MGLRLEIPGRQPLELECLLLDVNGTLAGRGRLLDGVAERTRRLSESLDLRLVSADTFGTLGEIAAELGVAAVAAADGEAKRRLVQELGPARTAVIGNGANDAAALRAAALGIAVVGPEGASSAAVAAADVVCLSPLDAFDLLLDPKALAATLRL